MIENICRGKRVDNNEWIEGYYVYDNTESTHRIVTSIDYSTGTFLNTQAPRVVDSTVGRYTGLKDKNGKKIFEGDICKYNFEDIGEQLAIIFWDNRWSAFHMDPIGNFQYTLLEDCEVIGNIHDNPDLLNIE